VPCWQIQRTTAKLEAADRGLLALAIQTRFAVEPETLTLYRHRTGDPLNGLRFVTDGATVLIGPDVVTVQGVGRDRADVLIDAIKQAYAREVVTVAAAQMGWDVEADDVDAQTGERALVFTRAD
jgi:hypothetical protein